LVGVALRVSDGKKIFFHGNFESQADWSFLSEEWEVFSLWDFLKSKSFTTWDDFTEALKEKLSEEKIIEAAGYSMGGRILLGLIDKGFRAKSLSFFSTHPGLIIEEDRNKRVWSDLQWKEKTLTSEWSDLHREWNEQPIFANSVKPYELFGKLEPYRSEIAHSFDILGLGRMPDFSTVKFPKDAQVQWVCGQHDHKFRALGQDFCKKHPKINYLVAFNCGHRIGSFAKEVL
jgi:hypothetical protein